VKAISEIPVRPLITICVEDIGSAKISTFSMINAEHICVEPRAIKPFLRFVTSASLIVLVTVY